MNRRLLVFCVFACLLFCHCKIKVNQSIHIRSDRKVTGSQISVNGNVDVGSNCVVRGSCKSVNGSIRIGSASTVGTIQSVNGSISIGADTRVSGSVASVNGSVDCSPGVKVKKDIKTINGSITLDSVLVMDDLESYNGHMRLMNGTLVKGDIKIKSGHNDHSKRKPVYIDIADRSVVDGNVLVSDPDLTVKIFLKTGGKINGRVHYAEVIEEDENIESEQEDEDVDF